MDAFKTDVHIPQGDGPFPVIIVIHGGGWCAGDKSWAFPYQQEYFAAAGYCIFDVQYGAKPDIVPLLVFHGTADSVVAVTQSQELNVMCDARGRKCVYIEIPRGEHCFEGDSNSGPSQVTLWAMERFMQLCRL